MEAFFCPFSNDWGTWGDWVGNFVALIGGIAVFYLGWEANKIVKTMERLTREAEEREGRALLIHLRGHIAEAAVGAKIALEKLQRHGRDGYISNQLVRESAREMVGILSLDEVEERLPRLHTIGTASDRLIEAAFQCKEIMSQADSASTCAEIDDNEMAGKAYDQLQTGLEKLFLELDKLLNQAFERPAND